MATGKYGVDRLALFSADHSGQSGLPDLAPSGGSVHQVGAIIVTYHPRLEDLSELLDAIVPQVGLVFVVDNKSSDEVRSWISHKAQSQNLRVTLLDENLGLAAAQNVGIESANKQGCLHILLLDQDSIPAKDMVAKLLAALYELTRKGKKVAAVGPLSVDRKSLRPGRFIRIGWTGLQHVACESSAPESCVPVGFLMSSGMLLSLASLQAVGAMDESLFVDNVDLDWCFRASASGLELYGVCSAQMLHSVGDSLFVSRLLLGRPIIRHAPVRLYYITRNRILLYRRSYTPAAWIIQDVLRLVAKFGLFSLLVAPRVQNTRMMLSGIWDGIRERGGRFS
jgi:rhamnosyltransferase